MSTLDRHTEEFDVKEEAVYREMQQFREIDEDWFARLKAKVNEPLEQLTEKLGDSAAADELQPVLDVLVDQLEDVSQWSLDPEDVIEAFRDKGYPVNALPDIRRLHLRAVEDVLAGVEMKYRVTGLGEGALSGAGGLAGALADIPVIATTAMRAISEYALYYGFDVDAPRDRHHAMLVLAAAASSGEARLEALGEVTDYAERLHGERGDIDEVPTSTVAELAERLVLRLGRGALVQSVPLVGAAIGGGMDEVFMKHVCKTAQHCYRERWLLRRYADSDSNG